MRALPFAALVGLAACGGSEKPPTLPTDLPTPSSSGSAGSPAPATPPAATPAPAAPSVVQPTALDEAARQRDAARVPLATSVVDAYPNWNGFFSDLVASYSPDGKRIVFGSTRDGIPEIYLGEVDKPGAAPVAITRGPERALSAVFTRDGTSILFTRDHEGDENQAIWRVNLDGSGAVNLTPDASMRHGDPILPRGVPGTMFYDLSSVRDTRTQLVAQDIAGGEPRVFFRQDKAGGLVDVTDDGSRALFNEYHSSHDILTFEVEVASGKTHRLYPPEGVTAGRYSVHYAADGKRVLLATDDGDKVVLLALDAATGKEIARYVDKAIPTGPIHVVPSPKNDRLAVSIDAGNHGVIEILDARTLKLQRTVKVPLGDVQVGAFRGDGRAFSILISRPDQPADVFAVDAASGAVKPLRADARAGLAALPPITSSIQSVKAFDGLTVPINQYLPRHAPGAKLPTIVIFHGGPATSYAVRWFPYARFFVSLGYAVLEPNVRGSSGFGRAYEMADDREKRADWLKDLEAVNAWTKRQPWCDPDRVVVWGQSYGGYTTLMALTRQPTLWRAGVDLYGPADLRKFLLTTDATIRLAFIAEFGDVDRDAALLEQFSPMRDVARIARPLFVYSGQHDPRVPRSESDAIVAAVRARGVPVEYMVAANEGHTVDRRETKIELLTRTARFLEDALR